MFFVELPTIDNVCWLWLKRWYFLKYLAQDYIIFCTVLLHENSWWNIQLASLVQEDAAMFKKENICVYIWALVASVDIRDNWGITYNIYFTDFLYKAKHVQL